MPTPYEIVRRETPYPTRLIVPDTTTLLEAALRLMSFSGKLLDLIDAKQAVAVISNRMRHEYEAILKHPKVRAKKPQLTDARVAAILSRVDSAFIRVPNPPILYPLPRDPNDEPILNLAIAVQADYLVTRDKDLLSVTAKAEFTKNYPFLAVVSPDAFPFP